MLYRQGSEEESTKGNKNIFFAGSRQTYFGCFLEYSISQYSTYNFQGKCIVQDFKVIAE